MQTEGEVREVLEHAESVREQRYQESLARGDDLTLWAVAIQVEGGGVLIEFFYAETQEEAEDRARYRSGKAVVDVLASEECP